MNKGSKEQLRVTIVVGDSFSQRKYVATMFYTTNSWSDVMSLADQFCTKLGEVEGATTYETNDHGSRAIHCIEDNKNRMKSFIAHAKKVAKSMKSILVEVSVEDETMDDEFMEEMFC